jgi:electron transport complex protein RnfB
MKLNHERPEQIAERMGVQAEEVNQVLEAMLSKGLIDARGPREQREYRAQPFVNTHGDLSLSNIDREYVELFEQYLAEIFAEELGKTGPANIRAFPAQQALSAEHAVLTFEQVSEIVAEATHYVISDCPCCRKAKLLGRDCKRRVHRCVSLYYEDDSSAEIRIEYREGKRATQEEVLALLQELEMEGFIHTGHNIQHGHPHICNCCPDCCPFLRMTRLNKAPYIIAPANYVAKIDAEKCIACGVCAVERCPVNAITLNNEAYHVDAGRCIGCGVCTLTCPSGALSLEQKEQIEIPPVDTMQWILHRALRNKYSKEEVR